MSKVFRIYVEKREDFAVEADEIFHGLKTQLKIDTMTSLSVVNRYDVQGVSEDVLNQGIPTILSEPMVDNVYREEYPATSHSTVFAIEYLPGQYDQRADACEQCFQLLTGEKNVKVKCARLIVIDGELNQDEVKRIQDYLINPVDQRLASLDKASDLTDVDVHIELVPIIEGFIDFDENQLNQFL
ncbi:MAG: phosphoribosylformylglycinamidine synthase, partial [Coprobacillus sp.]